MAVKQQLPRPLLDHFHSYILQLHQSLEPDTALADFSLESHGYIVLLEAGDDVRNLQEVGLNPEDQGLLGTYPEWVELKELSDGNKIYQIAVLYNNEYMMLFYSYPNTLDKEVEQWLKKQM